MLVDEGSVFPEGDLDLLYEEQHDVMVAMSECDHLPSASTARYYKILSGLILAANNCEDEEDVDAVHALWAASCRLPIPSKR